VDLDQIEALRLLFLYYNNSPLIFPAPHPDDAWFGLWKNLSGQGIVPRGIETLIDFKRWFYKQDLDVELFYRGGLASLI